MSRAQLLALGFTPKAIRHRIATRRLHPVAAGVYAVGRPQLTQHGRWMAMVLACGPTAALSHRSAGALWQIATEAGPISLSVTGSSPRRRPGLTVHRKTTMEPTTHHCTPVTRPAETLVDLAGVLRAEQLERAVNQADALDLIDPERLRAQVEGSRSPGAGRLRRLLDRRTFTYTESVLEQRFLPLARRAGLPKPQTQRHRSGFRVDFLWPELGLVVEADSLRYHRTAAQQTRDHERDQAHAVAGLTSLRFTHAQVRYEPGRVVATLRAVAARLVH
ncbi:MAG: DUF559 domain-containing protein [Solirubrobacterales bacterium]|nr:DUF559 domain-containing protein [Solirubrobacterales bacterium]